MARPVAAKDAKRVTETHRSLLTQLQAVVTKADGYIANIQSAAGKLAEQEAAKLLESIPVEELNREKQGIRVKALREAGLTTVAQLNKATVTRIAAVNGISDEGAKQIKQQVQTILARTRDEAKIKLSADDRNMHASALVTAIYSYKGVQERSQLCRTLLEEQQANVEQSLKALAPACGGLKWMFASDSAKVSAAAAYEDLSAMLDGEYGQLCEQALSLKGKQVIPQRTAAWADFEKDPISYFTILEAVCPDRFAEEAAVYGLPEELARSIQLQELHLDGLRCTLRRYQEWGVKYIMHQGRVLLGDEMGLGKTVQAIAAMVSLHNEGATHFMVVCPASVLTNWCREVQKHSPLKVTKVHGSTREQAINEWIEGGGVAVTTFETTGAIKLEEGFKCSMIIVDEAHYIKNPGAQRTANTKKLCTHAKRMLFMTGTALENNVEEMISLIRVLRPEVAQELQGIAFLSTAPQFREKVAPVYYRRKREDVLTELPELIENKDWCTISGDEERLYETAVLNQKYAEARRVSWSVEDLENSSKAQRLKEIIEDAEEDGRKIIVFSFFLDTVNKISAYFGERCMPIINGAVPPERRQEIIDEFEKAPAGSVLIAQIQSGGTGLNIQTASVVVICEPQFKPSIENQAISRAYRMGQARNVLVHRLLCDDTVDEKITELLEQKQAVFDAFADESAVAEE
ncbi:MAG: DEAD/DEAH box helicase, partial [Clostridia bacterium]|nr:DEAD/DEAH box helicase [Clostridia bacterium]